MVRYMIRRLLWAIVLFIAVTVVTYMIFFLIPVDPAKLAAGEAATPAEVKAVAHRSISTGRSATSTALPGPARLPRQPRLLVQRPRGVNSSVLAAAPVTASLVLGGAVMWMLIAVPIGVLSALHRGRCPTASPWSACSAASRRTRCGSACASYIFGYVPTTGMHWSFPSSPAADPGLLQLTWGAGGQFCGGPVDWFTHMMMPWIVFAILYAAIYVRMIRANVMETLNEDYVRTARAKGAPESIVMRRHVLRNAMLPVVTMLGMDIAIALGGAVLIEEVFGLPGLGTWPSVGLPVRLAEDRRSDRVRLDSRDRLQSAGRPALRMDRSANPAGVASAL